MFQLTEQHLGAMSDSATSSLRRRLTESLCKNFPHLTTCYSTSDLDRLCKRACDLAEQYLLEKESEVCVLAIAQLVYGADFAAAPWLMPMLSDTRKDGQVRILGIILRMARDQERHA